MRGTAGMAGLQAFVQLFDPFVRRWPPYPKWMGTMLTQLPIANEVVPVLMAMLTADQWQQRQHATREILAVLHQAQQDAGLPTPPDRVTEPLFDRPFLSIRTETVDGLLNGISDPLVHRLPPGSARSNSGMTTSRCSPSRPDESV